MKNKIIYSLLFLVTFFDAKSQTANQLPCGADELKEKYFQNNPQAKQQFENNQLLLKQALNNNISSRDRSAWDTIPVVYHIYYSDLLTFPLHGVNDSVVHESLKQLNNYFARESADTGTIAIPFKGLYVNSNIKFMLAKKDPNGNCTSGIVYHQSNNTWSSTSLIDTAFTWDTKKYLNIHCKYGFPLSNIGYLAGFSNYPGTYNLGDPRDVVGITYSSLKFWPTVLVHEVGHWLNLPHVFGNSLDTLTCGDDGISDTPQSVYPPSYSGPCPSSLYGNICDSNGINNIENIMHYHNCPKNFTQGQTNVMKATLTSSVSGRNNLSTTTNLVSTGVNITAQCGPQAGFYTPDPLSCANDSLHFFYLDSLNGTPVTSWQWFFPGGSPSTSNLKNPTVSYVTSGSYTVKLKVFNNIGSDSVSKTFIIKPKGVMKTSIVESFENISTLPIVSTQNMDWYVQNSNNKWQITTLAAATGAKSIVASPTQANYTAAVLYSNFRIYTNSPPYITFKYAYGQLNDSTNNTLAVNLELNCSGSFSTCYWKQGTSLSTVGTSYVNPHFIPTTTQWKTDTIHFPVWAQNKDVKIQFVYHFPNLSNTGDLYIDDINFHTPITTNSENLESLNLDVAIYPNPSSSLFNIELNDNIIYEIKLFDCLGQNIYMKKNLSSNRETIDVSELSNGIYFVQLQTEKGSIVKKIIKK